MASNLLERKKNIIVSPSVNKDFCWNYDAIKALISQGKLCCSLLTDVSGITPKWSKAEEEIDEYKGQINTDCSLNEGKSFLNDDITYPSISESPGCSKSLTFGKKSQRPEEMFSGWSVMDTRESLQKHDSLDAAAIKLSSNKPVTDNDLEILPQINFDQKIDDRKHCILQEILEKNKIEIFKRERIVESWQGRSIQRCFVLW